MANPLARVVMNSVAQKSGKVKEHSSRVGQISSTSTTPNLGRKETQLLSSLLNSKGKTTTTTVDSSYNKSTYGRSSNVGNVAKNTMKTLDSLTSGNSTSSNRAKVNDQKRECVVDKSRPHLKSLCSLDNISVGKTSVNNDNTSTDNRRSDNRDSSMINKLNLDQLAKGKGTSTNTTSTVKRENRASQSNKSGMTTLDDLAGEKTKNKKSTHEASNKDNSRGGMITTNNSFVKSKTVLNNLESYVPKVTLESIGKKGSLF